MSWEKKSSKRVEQHMQQLEDLMRGNFKVLTDRLRILETRMDSEIRDIKHEVDKVVIRVDSFIDGIGFERKRIPKGGRPAEGD